MKAENKFNKIIVIQSLAESDLKTGSRLYEDLNILKVRHKNLDCEIVNVKDENDLSRTLSKIEQEIKIKNSFPIIHIETHGSKYGLQLQKELTPWDSLKNAFKFINIACRNNLLVTLAACEGVYLTKIVRPNEPCPFCVLVAPTTKISAGQLEISFQSFYKELLSTFSGDSALEKLNQTLLYESVSFTFIHCINLYIDAFQQFKDRFCHGKARKRRIEDLVTKSINWGLVDNIGLKEVRRTIKYKIKNEEEEKEFFDKYKTIFFMSDQFPENSLRFDIRYEDVVCSSK